MDIIKSYSRRSFIMVMFFIAFLLILVNLSFYLGLNVVSEKVSFLPNVEISLPEIRENLGKIAIIQDNLKIYFAPISAGIFGLFGFLHWFFLRRSFVKLIKKSGYPEIKKKAETAVKYSLETIENKYNDRRLFLYLLSVLQREGRLLDFFSENLDPYEDAQIGAAVRSIHEKCKKVIDKNLAPKAVIKEKEGEEITVEEDFDPSLIKLTGNVTGEPPFKGIVRHRGWQAKRLDLPTLTSRQDSKIIAPAEVEIV